MNGRRVVHARGKVLGGSSSINGMIFQRGNPLDFERWGADPGMQSWDYAHCLPYFKRMETCAAGADAWRGGDGPLVLERGPATNPLFGAFFEAARQAGYPRDRRRQRLPPGRFRKVRSQHLAVAGASVPRAPTCILCMHRRNLEGAHAGARHARRVRRQARRRRRVRAGRPRLDTSARPAR